MQSLNDSLARIEQRLAGATEWRCRGCDDPQVALDGSPPPEDLLCHGCRVIAARPTLDDRLREAGVPAELRRSPDRAAWEAKFGRTWPRKLEPWPDDAVMGYAWGATGNGKSTAAAVLLGEQIRRGRGVRFVYGPLVLVKLQEEFDRRERVLMGQLLRVEVLVVDEPFVRLTNWGAEQMLILLGGRQGERRPTLVTSNLGPTALQPKHGPAPFPPALVSRLLSGAVVHFTGPDTRLERSEAPR